MTDRFRWAETLDPDETKDYELDWSAILEPINDTISSSTWTLDSKATTDGLTVTTDSFTDMTAVAWFSGGEADNIYHVLNEIQTAGGRTLQRTVLLEVEER